MACHIPCLNKELTYGNFLIRARVTSTSAHFIWTSYAIYSVAIQYPETMANSQFRLSLTAPTTA